MEKRNMSGRFHMQRVRQQLGVPQWGLQRGEWQVTIAVLDTGVADHPDLAGRVRAFRDFVGGRGLMYDDNGHGTHVCGILGGNGGLSGGRYRGMLPTAGLVVGKVLDKDGDGSAETMLAGMDWILRMRAAYRIRILNISVGIADLKEREKEEALAGKVKELWESGILVVCAAGNKGPGDGTISAVSGSSRVLTVGCHDGRYHKNNPGRCETYSGRGEKNAVLRKPDLVAPGTEIISCNAAYVSGRNAAAYVAKSGTSMATPIVAGAAALTMQIYPDMTNAECREKLLFTATDLGIPWNRQGWGMVNVRRLLE